MPSPPQTPLSPFAKRILIVEDEEHSAAYYREILMADGWEAGVVGTGQEALDRLKEQAANLLLLDIFLPDINGIEILKLIQDQALPVVVVAMTSQGSLDLAVQAMRLGAYDFLEKPFATDRLLVTMGNALQHLKLTHAVQCYEQSFGRDRFHGMLGHSLPMQAVFRIIESAAPSKATVFITGESGTGKELCAEAIHRQSPRRDQPFVVLNCAAIPKDLMESEIFGHVKGAFTGALASREGAASRADGGTLFLDEICEMDPALQSKFLRFFQSQRFQPVGGSTEISVDVRFVCATNRDPYEEVRSGRFREDLFYRLHVVPITVPPLRERGQDILLLACRFLQTFAEEEAKDFKNFAADVEAVLLSYPWPGNVRELQNVVRNIAVLHDGEQVTRTMLPPPLDRLEAAPQGIRRTSLLQATQAAPLAADMEDAKSLERIRPLWQVELAAIERAIELCDGNIQQAAELLDINPSTIYRKRKKWLPDDKGG